MSKQWEYKMTISSDTAELNALGEQGWEMVNFSEDTNNCRSYLFKREKREKRYNLGLDD